MEAVFMKAFMEASTKKVISVSTAACMKDSSKKAWTEAHESFLGRKLLPWKLLS